LEDVRDFLHALAAENFLHALAAEDDQTPTRPSPAARAWKRVSAWPWPATESPTTRPARP
jgi:hypothetical protein